jgi:hypothetical protein
MSTFHGEYLPSTREIRDVFADEIASLGGSVSDVLEDERYLYVRAVLAESAAVRPGDVVNAGVAVRVVSSEIIVHPYTFRQVCTNGAVVAQALHSRRLERTQSTDVFRPSYDIAVTLSAFGDAVRASAAPEAFATAANDMRAAVDIEADAVISLLPALARMPQAAAARLLPRILGRFGADDDRSVFGLLNAVTSVARDTDDPETRWALEELGGALPRRLMPLANKTPRVNHETAV